MLIFEIDKLVSLHYDLRKFSSAHSKLKEVSFIFVIFYLSVSSSGYGIRFNFVLFFSLSIYTVIGVVFV